MHDRAANWPERPLGKLLDIARQTVIPSAYPAEQFVHYSIPAWDTTRGPALEIGTSIGSAKICIKQPTILVSKLNPRIPRVVLVESPIGQPHCASTEFIPYVARADSVSLRFYKWFLQSPMFQRRLERIATGSTNSHTRAHPAETLKWNVPFPALEEQCRIVAMLDTVDEAIVKTEAVIAKLKQVRAGLLNDLLTRGLDKHGQLRDPITHPEQFQDSPLGRIPKEWGMKTCQSVCREIVVGIVVKPAQYYVEEGVPVLRSANVREEGIQMTDLVFISDESNALLSKSIIRTGDVVTVRTGYPGTSCVVPSALDGANCVDLIISRPSAEIVPTFLALWINSPFGRDQVLRVQGGLAQQHFNVGELKTLLIAKPGRNEQVRIVERIATLDSCISLEVETEAKLSCLKSGLMTDLLTGRVRVPEKIAVAP